MNTRSKKAGRPRAAPSDGHASMYPTPSESLLSLKKSNPKSFVHRMINFLRQQKCHPDVGVGWWCCFPTYMSHLLNFLADVEDHDHELWRSFREQVALQLRNCRQCVVKYHEAVSQWELREQDLQDADVVKTRVQSLLDWDCERVLPLIIAGADVRDGDTTENAIALQCREAFFEALVSLRLCTSTKFCKGLGKLFQKRIPARNEEDTLPFIRQLGFVPEGLIALCFHGLPVVQLWALRVYKSSRKGLRVPREPLFFVLRRAVKCLRTLQDQVCLDLYLDPNTLDHDFAKLEAQWEGVSALICSMKEDAIQSFARRYKNLPLVAIACAGMSLNSEKIALLSSKLLRVLLRSMPFDLVFVQKSTTSEVLLDSIFLALKKHLKSSSIAERILSLICCALVFVHQNLSASTVSELFKKCLTELYDIAKESEFCCFEVRLEEHGASTDIEKNSRVRKSFWKTTAEVLQFFYTNTSPSLPLDDTMLISTIVTASLKQDAFGNWSWNLFKCVLLTDVFNILRSLKTGKDLHVIERTFLDMRPKVGGLCPEEQALLVDVVNPRTSTPAKLTWVGPLWRRVLLGEHLNTTDARNETVISREMSILLDMHRLVGVFDPRMVQLVLEESFSGSSSTQSTRERMHSKERRRVIELIASVQETILARLRWACSELPDKSWLHHLPFHVAHLLSSAKKDISKQCLLGLRTLYGLKDVVSVIPQSKLLVQLMKQDERTAEMMVDGFTSSLRTIVVLSDMTSMRTYAVFLQWYRILLDSEYTALLRDETTLKWTLASVRSFSDNWSGFESNIERAEFRETCCQFFKHLREVWTRLYDEVQSNNKTGKDHEPALIRGVTRSLFKMNTVKDETVLASWVTTMSSMADKWNKSQEHRTAMGKIINIHANGVATGSRLSHEQCSKLAKAGNLDDVQPVLLAWSRKNETQDRSKNTMAKVYSATKIDQFFPKKTAKDSNISVTNGLQSANNRGRSGTARGMMTMRTRLPLMRAPVKGVKSTGTLSELRKEYSHDGARSKRMKKVRTELQPEGVPRKTFFEMQREQYIAMRARDTKEAHQMISGSDSDNQHSVGPLIKEAQRDAEEHSSLEVETDPDEQDRLRCTVPSDVRCKKKRNMDLIYRQLLSNSEPSLSRVGAGGIESKAFSTTEDYVDFWEPLLVAEYRASARNTIAEENMFAARFKKDPLGYRYCRTAFEVQEPPSSVGHFHHLRMQLCEDQGGQIKGSSGGYSSSQFSIFDAQPTDIAYLLIPPARCTVSESVHVTEALALVSTKKVNDGVLHLELRICFEGGLETAPGKGRRIQVSRLMSLTTFQRKIEALWLVPFLPDGLLWPILDPSKGFAVNDYVEKRNEELSLAATRFSRNFVSDLESKGSLNESQASAINSVLSSAGHLFGYDRSEDKENFFKKNHGALTLIQGPPGTGKTSTILNLLSTLVLTSSSRKYPRMTRILLDDHFFRVKIPAIRVLVCAPSNAAVDEVMLRVMENGLPTPGGGRACPWMVRVGHGTTQERLKRMELTSVASCHNYPDENIHLADTRTQLGEAQSRLTDHCRILNEINDSISTVSKERRDLIALEETQRKHSQVGTASHLTPQIHSLTEKLTFLHGEKEALKRHLSRDRDNVKEKNQARRREETKRMCSTLNRSTLVFSTLNSAGHEMMRTLSTSFDVIIIDEAAQCIEPESLIPMTIGLGEKNAPKFTQVVMVGDPKQLPATILSTDRSVLRLMGISLFERACLPDPARATMLRVQYRMHPEISRFPNKQFYSGLLQDGENVRRDSAFRSFHNDRGRRFGPLTFLDTASVGTEERRTAKGSVYNLGEARVVITVLKSLVRLYEAEDLKNEIVILSPYNHQVNVLKQFVRECNILEPLTVEISTIDGIQGREKSIVVLSTVRGKNSRDIGFVKDERRMNVALTRAKDSLLIVGDAPVLSRSSSLWHELLKHCRDQGRLIVLPKRAETLFPERVANDDLMAASRPVRSDRQPFVRSTALSSVKPIRAQKEHQEERTPEKILDVKPCHTDGASNSPTVPTEVQTKPLLRSVKRLSENACHAVNEAKRMKQHESSVSLRTTAFSHDGDRNAGAFEKIRNTRSPVNEHSLVINGEKRLKGSGELDSTTAKVTGESNVSPSSSSQRGTLGSRPLPNTVGGLREVPDRRARGLPDSKKALPLRSNVLHSREEKTKTWEALAARNIKAIRENVTSSQRMMSRSSFGPFAPSRRKSVVSPFASTHPNQFVYPPELKTSNADKKNQSKVSISREFRRVDSGSHPQQQKPVSRATEKTNAHNQRQPTRVHQIHSQQPHRAAPESRAGVLSRHGARALPSSTVVVHAQQPSASKFAGLKFKPSSNQRVQLAGTQSNPPSVGMVSRSRPLGKFPSVAPGVQKPAKPIFVGTRPRGTAGDEKAKRMPFVGTRSVNHRGFVKKQTRQLGMGRGSARGCVKDAVSTGSASTSLTETRMGTSRSRALPPVAMASKGSHVRFTRPFIQGRREGSSLRQSSAIPKEQRAPKLPVPRVSLLERLQAGQEETLNMLKGSK